MAYTVRTQDQIIDYDGMAELAQEHRPKLIIAGGSAYSRVIDFARFREVADSVGAKLMVDMAHFAGLVAAGLFPNPLPHAHVVTTTTHKTLRGPRGGMVLSNDLKLGKKIDSAVFPGIQGGPLMHVIAGKAVAFGEALSPDFKDYAKRVMDNARVLAESLSSSGFAIVSGGTDSHLMLVDLRPKGVTGKVAEESLERANITCNKNGIPFSIRRPPAVTSGLRPGQPGRHHARLWPGRVPPDRPTHRRGRRRSRDPWRRGQCRSGGASARRSEGLDRAVPDLHLNPIS